MAEPIKEHDIFGAEFKVGDYVMVRCLVTALSNTAAGPGGCGDTVSLTVETPGNLGEQAGVTLTVSPVQCRRAGNPNQA